MIDDDGISDGDVKVIKHPACSRSHMAHVPLKDNTFAIRGFYLLKTDGQDYAYACIHSSKIYLSIFLFCKS